MAERSHSYSATKVVLGETPKGECVWHEPTSVMSAVVQTHSMAPAAKIMCTIGASTFLWLKKTKAQAAGLHRLGVGTPLSG